MICERRDEPTPRIALTIADEYGVVATYANGVGLTVKSTTEAQTLMTITGGLRMQPPADRNNELAAENLRLLKLLDTRRDEEQKKIASLERWVKFHKLRAHAADSHANDLLKQLGETIVQLEHDYAICHRDAMVNAETAGKAQAKLDRIGEALINRENSTSAVMHVFGILGDKS